MSSYNKGFAILDKGKLKSRVEKLPNDASMFKVKIWRDFTVVVYPSISGVSFGHFQMCLVLFPNHMHKTNMYAMPLSSKSWHGFSYFTLLWFLGTNKM